MSTQRKFNYSFRNRNSNRVEKSQTNTDGTDEAQAPAENEIKNEPRSFPSECETEDAESHKIPPLDQPISAAELEHRKNTIRGLHLM